MVAALSRTVAAPRQMGPRPATTPEAPLKPRLRLVPSAGPASATPGQVPSLAPGQVRSTAASAAGPKSAAARPVPAAARPVPAAARPALAEPPLRLTARGRMVVAAVAAVLVTALLVVVSVVVGAGPAAQATNHPVSRQAAEKGLARVTVRPGESLWSVAEAADPDADTRIVVQEIIELNGLNGMVVNPGERLLVPRG